MQKFVNHRIFERNLRPRPSGQGHVCLSVGFNPPDHSIVFVPALARCTGSLFPVGGWLASERVCGEPTHNCCDWGPGLLTDRPTDRAKDREICCPQAVSRVGGLKRRGSSTDPVRRASTWQVGVSYTMQRRRPRGVVLEAQQEPTTGLFGLLSLMERRLDGRMHPGRSGLFGRHDRGPSLPLHHSFHDRTSFHNRSTKQTDPQSAFRSARPGTVSRPELRQGYPLNLSISISGGRETNQDSPSNGERTGKSPK